MPDSTTGIGHTRWATHGGPTDSNAHPHVSQDRRVAVIHNGIIENFAELRDELTAAGVLLASETDTEVVAHLLAAELPLADDDLTEAMRRVCRRLEGAFTLLAIDRAQPDLVVGARRNSPLVVGRRRGRELPRLRRRRLRRPHPRGARARPGPGRHHHADVRSTITDFAGAPGRGSAVHRRLGHLGRGEGRLRPVHAEGDRGAAQGRCRLPARPDQQGLPPPARRDPHRRGHPALHQQGRRHRLRHGGERRHGREVRDRALDAAAGRGRAGQRVPLPRPDRRPGLARHRHLAVGRDHGHPHGPAAREGAGGQDARHLQHGRLDDPARVGRGPVHLRRAGDRGRLDQGVPHADHRRVPRRPVPRAGARHDVRGRDPVRPRRAGRHAEQGRPRPRHDRAGARAGPRVRRLVARCCSSAATWASRSRSRGRSS